MNIRFVASISIIAADPRRSRRLFVEALGLPLKKHQDDGYSSDSIAGCRRFEVWPLRQAAGVCFGRPKWPADRVIPQASIEFEVQDAEAVGAASDELKRAGFGLLHSPRTEPWGQTVTRLLSDDGLIIGISYQPWLHDSQPE